MIEKDESPGFLLWQLSTLWQRKINQILKPFNLTHVQFVVMASIYWFMQKNEMATQIKVSHLSKVDPVVVSNVLKLLDAKAFTERKESRDLRAKEVVLTKSGKDVLKPALNAVELFDAQFFGQVDTLPILKNAFHVLIDAQP
jgi:MarR family transcriptional regulator, organic hydroperoxide resistance regulator